MTQQMFFFLLVLFPFFAQGQSVHVEKKSSRIHGENIPGYQVALSSPEVDVRNALEKYLKLLGKTKSADDVLTTEEPVIFGKKHSTALYANTRQAGTTTAAWIGMANESGESSDDRNLEKLVREFGVAFYRNKIQLQVDESLRALQAVERQQTRLVNQNKDLNNKVEGNKRKKIELERSLVENKVELEDLTKRLQANIKAQDSIAVATEQIKKVVEMHREKQRAVN
jgi:hypothetical protein